MTRRVEYTFNGVPGALEQNGRTVRYYKGSQLSDTSKFRSVAAATSRFEGDIRSMRKNDCYQWPAPEEMQRALLWT